MLDTNTLTSTPEPHRLLVLGRLRLRRGERVRADRCTPTLLLLSVSHERGVRAVAVTPNPVGDLDRIYRRIGTMKEHKQGPKSKRISVRIARPRGHLPQRNRSSSRDSRISRSQTTTD
jgi:hypothetical protein